MGQKDRGEAKFQLDRRQFLKTGAAAAAAGALGIEFFAHPSRADAAAVDATYHTTCPYCSASCGQLVDVDDSGNVLDVYGDSMSPFNAGGLCAKGAGAYQLVTNPRRIGAFTGTHPVNPVFEADTTTYPNGVGYKRTGNGNWAAGDLQTLMNEAALALKTDRGVLAEATGYNSKGVAFFGSSHLNNDQCYLFRKIIANFGTTNTEHQARI